MENKIERLKMEFFARGHIANPKKNRKYYYVKKDNPSFPNDPELVWKKIVTKKYIDNYMKDDEYNTEEEYEDAEWIETRKKILLECNK